MTLVHVDLRTPDGGPAVGVLEWIPTRRRTVDDHVVLPDAVTVDLAEGVADLEVDATGADWAWRVVERVRKGVDRYVQVPDVAEAQYVDLVEVDPDTLDPAAEPEAAWTTALDAVDARVTDVEDAAATHVVDDVTYTAAPAKSIIRRVMNYVIASANPDLQQIVNSAGRVISALNEWGALRGRLGAFAWYDSLVRAIREDGETATPGGGNWDEIEDRRAAAEVRTLHGHRWVDGATVDRDSIVGHVFTIHPWETLAAAPGTLRGGTLIVQRTGVQD